MIFVSIITRSQVQSCLRTIDLLRKRSHDLSNFKIHLVVDNDQIEMYRTITLDPNISVSYVPPCNHLLQPAYMASIQAFLDDGCFFFWPLPDDLLSLDSEWDSRILATRNLFDDGILYLYTESLSRGRRMSIKKGCYGKRFAPSYYFRSKKVTYEEKPYCLVESFGEMFPILSREFVRLSLPVFEYPNHHCGIDIIFGAIAQSLCYRYKINRARLGCGSLDCVDQKKTAKILLRFPPNQELIHEAADRIAIHIAEFREKGEGK
jgi:hypothetical protein